MSSTSPQALPQSSGFVSVKLLDGGSFSASWDKVHAGAKDIPFRMYIWSFYIFNAALDRRVLWDVGVTSDKADYSNFVQDFIWEELQPVGPTRSIQEQLLCRESLRSDDVDAVIFSHAHWDHSRPIRASFPRAIGYFGPDTQEFCSPGHLESPSMQWDGRFFDPVNVSERWETLKGPWTNFGPFERAMDFFGDGSFWVIQAPGHMPGNLCAAAKLEGGEWVLLGSDCCHSRELLDGTKDFALFDLPSGGKGCLQMDIPEARKTISSLRTLEKDFNVHMAFAHDTSWMKEGTNAVLMSLLDDDLRKAAREQIPYDQIIP